MYVLSLKCSLILLGFEVSPPWEEAASYFLFLLGYGRMNTVEKQHCHFMCLLQYIQYTYQDNPKKRFIKNAYKKCNIYIEHILTCEVYYSSTRHPDHPSLKARAKFVLISCSEVTGTSLATRQQWLSPLHCTFCS